MIAQPIQTKQLSLDGYQWNLYSPRVAAITNELRHFATVYYFQFPDWDSAHDFWKHITNKHLCTRAQVRSAERFSTGWECKVWNMPQTVLEALILRDSASGAKLYALAQPKKVDRTRNPKALPLPPLYREWQSIRSTDSISYEAVA